MLFLLLSAGEDLPTQIQGVTTLVQQIKVGIEPHVQKHWSQYTQSPWQKYSTYQDKPLEFGKPEESLVVQLQKIRVAFAEIKDVILKMVANNGKKANISTKTIEESLSATAPAVVPLSTAVTVKAEDIVWERGRTTEEMEADELKRRIESERLRNLPSAEYQKQVIDPILQPLVSKIEAKLADSQRKSLIVSDPQCVVSDEVKERTAKMKECIENIAKEFKERRPYFRWKTDALSWIPHFNRRLEECMEIEQGLKSTFESYH